jgi:hypothetical protein
MQARCRLLAGRPGAQGLTLSRLAQAGGAGWPPRDGVAGPLGAAMGAAPAPGAQYEQATSETEPTDGRVRV